MILFTRDDDRRHLVVIIMVVTSHDGYNYIKIIASGLCHRYVFTLIHDLITRLDLNVDVVIVESQVYNRFRYINHTD